MINSSFLSIRRGARRGAASVEAVVVLPVFVILFVSLIFVQRQALARRSAELKARTCAWQYSMNNCSQVPPGCDDILDAQQGEARIPDEITEALGDGPVGAVGRTITTFLQPMLDAAFGRAVTATTEQSFPRPRLYGGETGVEHGRYHLACNLERKELLDVAKDTWDIFYGQLQ